MPKKQKQSKKKIETVNENVFTEAKATPKKATAPRARGKTAAKKTSARTARKAASPREVIIAEGSSIEPMTKTVAPTEEDIRIRAYFISERRHRLAIPGDSTGDWIEARRQLLVEAGVQ